MAITLPPNRSRRARHHESSHHARPPADVTRSGAQLVCESLLAHGVDLAFGYPGGAALTLYDQLVRYPIRHVLVRHEQHAAHAADGYARATGKTGVCIATSGPGATNLVTGIATAFMDSVPMVALTGQVASGVLGTQAFQEVDIVAVAQPITKAAFRAMSAAEIPDMLAEAFALAQSGRPGPVLVDLPKDVQAESVSAPARLPVGQPEPATGDVGAEAAHVASLLARAKRPVLIVGRGLALAGGAAALCTFAERLSLPVAHTLLGVSLLPDGHPLGLGMVGMHGTVQANLAVHDADLVLAIGCRLDDRVACRPADFAARATIVHVDLDPSAFGRCVRADVPILADARAFVEALDRLAEPVDRSDWWTEIAAWRDAHASCGATSFAGLGVPDLLRTLHSAADSFGRPATVVADVGQHQMFSARHYGYTRPGSFFTSGGLGTMGYGIPAAMGVQLARPDETVWAVVGDGGFQMTSTELATFVAEGLPVKVVVVNNGYLGMVRQWQEAYYRRNYAASVLPATSFVKLAEAYGMPGFLATDAAGVADAAARALAHPGPALIEVRVAPEENVYPMVSPGESLGDVRCVEGLVRRV